MDQEQTCVRRCEGRGKHSGHSGDTEQRHNLPGDCGSAILLKYLLYSARLRLLLDFIAKLTIHFGVT